MLVVSKCDSLRDRPYGVWSTAVQTFIHQLLVESDSQLEQWRTKLCQGLGPIAQALIDLVPDLRLVLSDVPPIPRLEPRETQARLCLALARFLQACATPQHPLVLFLDDFQWSDHASSELLEGVLGQIDAAALLLVVALRSDENEAPGTVMPWLKHLAERHIQAHIVTLRPLEPTTAITLLSDVLGRHTEDVRELAALVERTTGNNPLLIRQFLEHAHTAQLIHFTPDLGWTWDTATLAESDIPEGSVAFILAKLRLLDASARSTLDLASCIGNEFDIAMLLHLRPMQRAELERILHSLCEAAFIAPSSHGYRFLHDRLREAAHELLSDEERESIHFAISRALLETLSDAEQASRAFQIVEHLNRALPRWTVNQRVLALELNVQAGKTALAAGAASTAETYLAVARGLLRDEDWELIQPRCFELLLRSVDSALLRGDLDSAIVLLNQCDHRTRDPLQAAQCSAKRIQVYALTRSPEECTRYALEILQRYNIHWPLQPSHMRTRIALESIWWKLCWHGVDSALRPAQTVDLRCREPMLVFAAAAGVMSRVLGRRQQYTKRLHWAPNLFAGRLVLVPADLHGLLEKRTENRRCCARADQRVPRCGLRAANRPADMGYRRPLVDAPPLRSRPTGSDG
jgi:predicted ATPase